MPFLKRRTTEIAEPPSVDDETMSEVEAPPVTPAIERRPVARETSERPKQSRSSLLLATLFAVLIVAATVLGTWLASRNDGAGGDGAVSGAIPQPRSTLLVVEDVAGRAVSLALLLDDDAGDRSLFVVPPFLSMQLPGYGDGLLADASVIEGANLTELALINELGIRIDQTLLIPSGDIARLIREPIRITLPNPFIVETSDGGVVTAGAGTDFFVPATAETLLITPGPDSTLEWLQRQRAVWEALAGHLAENPGFGSAVPGIEELAPEMADALVTVLPIDRVGAGSSELYVLARKGELLAERIAPFVFSASSRPRVEILNGTRVPGVTRPLAEILIRGGFRVVKTDNAQLATQRVTLVIAQGVFNQQAALDVATELAVGDIVVETTGSSVVDVSIIVGRDLSDSAG